MADREGWRTRFIPESARIPAFSVFAALNLALALCLGGGTRSGLLSDVVAQLAAIPLLLWALWKLRLDGRSQLPKFGLGLLALVVVFPLLQLLPVWPMASLHGAGRLLEQDVLAAVSAAPRSRPVTVAGELTLLSVISLLPAVAIFLAMLALPARHRRWFTVIVIGYGFASVLLGLLQLSQGPASSLRFYAITNVDDAVGFFANRNHFSALLNCTLILTSAWLMFLASEAGATSSLGPWRQVLIIAGFTLIVALLAGQVMARSRAGVGIAVVATMLSCLLFPGLSRSATTRASPLRLLVITIALGVIIAVQYGAFRLVERFGADPLQDARKTFASNTFEAILAYLPFGSGLGTFTRVYPAFEGVNSVLAGTYVNRAHNDFVEYVLETGAFGALLLGLALLYLLGKAVPLWRPGRSVTLDLMLQRAAAGVVVLILLHSIFDYPVRTTAMLSLLAVMAGLLLSKPADAGHFASAETDAPHPAAAGPSSEAPTAMPTARKAWGQDIAWPDAWKSSDKSNLE